MHLTLRRGSPLGRSFITRDGDAVNSRLEPPPHYDDERREIWAETIARLTAGGRIFRADAEILNTYVEAVRSHRQA